jgi:hypothetical protein
MTKYAFLLDRKMLQKQLLPPNRENMKGQSQGVALCLLKTKFKAQIRKRAIDC